jgi:hypothetical protein
VVARGTAVPWPIAERFAEQRRLVAHNLGGAGEGISDVAGDGGERGQVERWRRRVKKAYISSVVAAGIFSVILTSGCVATSNSGPPGTVDASTFERAMAQSDYRIVGREGRVRPIRLGMYMDEVVAILGQPEIILGDGKCGEWDIHCVPYDYLYDDHLFNVSFSGTPGASGDPDSSLRLKVRYGGWD